MRKLDSLNIWKRSVDLCEKVYKETKVLPDSEKFGLLSQMRRAAVSISSNVAEGAGRRSDKEFAQFLSIANGSSYELQTQIEIVKRLNFLNENACDEILKELDEIQKMNFGLQTHLRKPKSSNLTSQN